MAEQYRLLAIVIVLLAGVGPTSRADGRATDSLPTIDVFTTEDRPIRRIDVFLDENPSATLRIHRIDTIERFEKELSVGLSARPDDARRDALKRLQWLSTERQAQLEHTAKALVIATQLGIEKVPAVVFDRAAVIYGITDLPLALNIYQSWQKGETR